MKIAALVLCTLLVVSSRAFGFEVVLTMTQESIPYSDSGQWVPCMLDLTNISSHDVTVRFELPSWNYAFDTSAKKTFEQKYDTVLTLTPQQKIVLRCLYRYAIPDTTYDEVQLQPYLYPVINVPLRGKGNCAPVDVYQYYHQYVMENSSMPADPGNHVYTWNFNYKGVSSTPFYASYQIVGEFSDRFDVQAPRMIYPDTEYYDSFTFHGAPQPVVQDTLVATYTNCLGSFVRRYPILGYSHYQSSHIIRMPAKFPDVPFLGSVVMPVMVVNTSNATLEVRKIKADDTRSPGVFTLQYPSTGTMLIPPHDSMAVLVGIKDVLKYDLGSNQRQSVLTCEVVVKDEPGMIDDSTFRYTFTVGIDLFSPGYISTPPLIAHNVHPAGIIFGNSTGTADFQMYLTNDDIETYKFFPPVFDDNRFTISTTPPFPATVQNNALFINEIKFKGTADQTVQTQLHWYRSRVQDGMKDTVSIDVIAAGSSLGVSHSRSSSGITLWPNPAQNTLNLTMPSNEPVDAIIIDLLGREVLRGNIVNQKHQIDISKLHTGTYQLVIPALSIDEKFEVGR